MRTRFSSFRIDIGARRYIVDCRVIPPRAPAHAGADHPRFLDPGSVGGVEIIRVRKSGFDVTDALDGDLRLLIRDRCARLAGVGRSSAPSRSGERVLEFER